MSDETNTPPQQRSPKQAVRESDRGAKMTDSQVDKALALTGVLEREIRRSGKFREPLTDYAHAYARGEKFDALQGEAILRDVFEAQFGQSMNELRLGLAERESQVRAAGPDQALAHAHNIAPLIRDGDTMPFYRAYDVEAVRFAQESGITETGAKMMMKEAYQQAEGRDLYQAGKELEEQHHAPKRDAERQSRTQQRTQGTSPAHERRQSFS